MKANYLKLFVLFLSSLAILSIGPRANALGLELYGAKTRADVELLNSWGFTQIILENDALFEEAKDFGMTAVQANWWSTETKWDFILRQATSASQHSNLTSINVMDEPVYNDPIKHSPELYQSLRERLKNAGITAPLSITIYGPKPKWSAEEVERFKGYLKAIDVLRIDPYPVVGNRPLRTVFDWATSAREFIKESGREIPLTVILQAWSPGDDPQGVPQLPTVAQLRNMAYQAFFSGAEKISFYNFDLALWDRFPGFTEGFKKTIKELTYLQSTFGSSENYDAAIDSDGILRVRAHLCGAPDYDINTTSKPQFGLEPLEIKIVE